LVVEPYQMLLAEILVGLFVVTLILWIELDDQLGVAMFALFAVNYFLIDWINETHQLNQVLKYIALYKTKIALDLSLIMTIHYLTSLIMTATHLQCFAVIAKTKMHVIELSVD